MLLIGLYPVKAQENVNDLPEKGQIRTVAQLSQPGLKNATGVYESANFNSWELEGFTRLSKQAGITTGSYSGNSVMSAVSNSLTLPSLSAGERLLLTLSDEFSLESDYDKGNLLISNDNGATWQSVYEVSGQSGRREVSVNISGFAGQSVLLGLSFISDDSFEGTGWNVYSLRINKGIRGGSGGPGASTPVKELKITGINTSNFPEYVYVDFEYLEGGVQSTTPLTLSDLDLYTFITGPTPEADLGICPIGLYGPEDVVRPLDIIFLIDNSGSMSLKISQIKDNIANFVNAINPPGQPESNDIAFGMVRFGQAGPPIEKLELLPGLQGLPSDNLTKEYPYYIGEIQNRNVVDGWQERGYEALDLALAANFRPSAQKIFILVTDENTTDPNNMGPTTKAQIIAKLKAQNAVVFAWIPSTSDYDATYADIAAQTGGSRYDIHQPILGLIDDVVDAVKGTYTLRFCPFKKEASSEVRGVTISLLDDPSVFASGTYIPAPNKEYIVRDPVTIALGDATIPKNQSVDLCFIVKDQIGPFASSGQLFVRDIGSTGAFTAIAMSQDPFTPDTARRWCGTVPDIMVLDPGFAYYAVVTYPDGHQLKSPPTKESFFAWNQAVMPNYPPEIIVTSTGTPATCSEFDIKFNVTDITNGFNDVKLYYREIGTLSAYKPVDVYAYTSGTMPTTGSYTVPVMVTGAGVEYFITATDDYGITAVLGDPNQPLRIRANNSTVVITSSSMIVSFDNYTLIECVALQVGDTLRAYYTNLCGGLSLAGELAFDPYEYYQDLVVYGNTSITSKNGYAVGENLRLEIIRDGKAFPVQLRPGLKYIKDDYIELDPLSIKPVVTFTVRYGAIVVPYGDDTPSNVEGTRFEVATATTRTFNLNKSGCGTFTLLGVNTSNTRDFSVSFNPVTETFDITYYATVNNATSTITVTTTGGSYEFDVLGIIFGCTKTLYYGVETIPNGDVNPTAVKGTDFGQNTTPLMRSFALDGPACSPSLAVTGLSSSNPDFSVSYVGTTINVTYGATANASGIITVSTNHGPFTFSVLGTVPTCALELNYGAALVVNGDNSPSASEGTDFGSTSSPVTRAFVLSGTGCSPAIISASSGHSAFTTSVSGTTVYVTYEATADASTTISLNTSVGAYTFDVMGKSSSTCTMVNQLTNPMPSGGAYAKIMLDMTSLADGSLATISAQIVNVATSATVQTYDDRNISTYYPYWENWIGGLTPGTYILKLNVSGNGACSGVFNYIFVVL